MAERFIDLDRGVHMRTNAGAGGIQIYMYVDTPGVYLDAFGHEVPEELAEGAGFDVEHLRKKRQLAERRAAAIKQVEDEMAAADEGDAIVVRERAGWQILDIGLGRHILKDPDGNNINPVPLPRQSADALLEQLTPNAKDEKPKKGAAPKEEPAA